MVRDCDRKDEKCLSKQQSGLGDTARDQGRTCRDANVTDGWRIQASDGWWVQASDTERLAFVAPGSLKSRRPLGVPIADAGLAPASIDGGHLAPPPQKKRFSLTRGGALLLPKSQGAAACGA